MRISYTYARFVSINVISSITEYTGPEYGGDPVLTSIVIATFNKLDYTRQCIESIREYTEPGSYEIIVVDNNSTDDTKAWLRDQPDLRIVFNDENLGFPKACNQGIEISTGNNILLLNNDTIVTRNWLSNLIAALYSSDGVGAVGSITNSCSYGQAIPVSYTSLAEMHAFAEQHNGQPNPSAWEERLKLIGYCMLIKKPILDQIGLLDERFTPGNYEDDDLSLRIRLAGYKLLLCKDTFIHHYGSVSFKDAPPQYVQLMKDNNRNFQDKWGFDPDKGNQFRTDLCGAIQEPSDSRFRVLEIGCGCGGNLLQIRNRYPNAELFGIELNEAAAKVAAILGEVYVGETDEIIQTLPLSTYDRVIVSEPYSQWKHPEHHLSLLNGLLKEGGQLVAAIPNSLYYGRVKPFLLGLSPARANDGLTVSETQHMFSNVGFTKVSLTALTTSVSSDDRDFIRKLAGAAGVQTTLQYEAAEFLVAAVREEKGSGIKTVINNILSQKDVQASIKELSNKDPADVVNLIDQAGYGEPVELLNYLAVQMLEHNEYPLAQQYLQHLFERDPDNPQTMFNLGLTMYMQGYLELALEWFGLLPEKSEQVLGWMQNIRQELTESKQSDMRLRFTLRRIEHDLFKDESLEELTELLRNRKYSVEDISKQVLAGVVEKARVLTIVATECFQRGIYDPVIELMGEALRIEPSNSFALFQLALILNELGEYDSARMYLEKIAGRDEEAEGLLQKLMAGQNRDNFYNSEIATVRL
nr:glycosyltransferase [Cohnella sp. CFH 77786]